MREFFFCRLKTRFTHAFSPFFISNFPLLSLPLGKRGEIEMPIFEDDDIDDSDDWDDDEFHSETCSVNI